MDGMSDIRNEIEQRLGVFARQGAKVEFGNVDRLGGLLEAAYQASRRNNKAEVKRLLNEAKKEIDSSTPAHMIRDYRDLKASMSRPGAKSKMGSSQVNDSATTADLIREAQRLRDVIKTSNREFDKTHLRQIKQELDKRGVLMPYGASEVLASRPGAKATMGILDRISRGLSAATAKPVDPTTPQYLSGLTAAKKAAEEAKSNYEYMADLNDARFKQLDNYVKVTSNMITKMNSSADIQRLIAGLKAAVAARVFVQSSMKTPFSRSQAKIVFASQIGNGNNAFANQIQNAIDKITKLHFEIANFATDLEASWYYHRNKDKGKRYKALVEEAGNLLNQVDDFASTVIMLGRGRNQSTESMRADAAKAEDALRKLPAFKERLGMIRRAAAKVDAFSRLGDKTEFADGCGSGAGGFKPGNTCGKEDGKAGGGGAKKKKKPTSPKPATPRLTRREERRQEVENRVKARQAAERARRGTESASAPKAKRAPKVSREETARAGNDAPSLRDSGDSLNEDLRKARKMRDDVMNEGNGEGADRLDTLVSDLELAADEERRNRGDDYDFARSFRHSMMSRLDVIANRYSARSRKVNNCNVDSKPLSYGKEGETEQDKAGLKLMEKADKAVSDKIRTLIKEGKPQDQAVAIALDMKRRGEL